jgi:hypothetical protein
MSSYFKEEDLDSLLEFSQRDEFKNSSLPLMIALKRDVFKGIADSPLFSDKYFHQILNNCIGIPFKSIIIIIESIALSKFCTAKHLYHIQNISDGVVKQLESDHDKVKFALKMLELIDSSPARSPELFDKAFSTVCNIKFAMHHDDGLLYDIWTVINNVEDSHKLEFKHLESLVDFLVNNSEEIDSSAGCFGFANLIYTITGSPICTAELLGQMVISYNAFSIDHWVPQSKACTTEHLDEIISRLSDMNDDLARTEVLHVVVTSGACQDEKYLPLFDKIIEFHKTESDEIKVNSIGCITESPIFTLENLNKLGTRYLDKLIEIAVSLEDKSYIEAMIAIVQSRAFTAEYLHLFDKIINKLSTSDVPLAKGVNAMVKSPLLTQEHVNKIIDMISKTDKSKEKIPACIESILDSQQLSQEQREALTKLALEAEIDVSIIQPPSFVQQLSKQKSVNHDSMALC